MKTHDLVNRCPWCDVQHDAATGLTGAAAPNPDDISICFNCGSPAVFTDDLELRRMTGLEAEDFRGTDVYQRYVLARAELDWSDRDRP